MRWECQFHSRSLLELTCIKFIIPPSNITHWITDVHAQDIAGAHAHAQDIVGTWPWILCMMFTTSAITLR